jgi:hypothetical protein
MAASVAQANQNQYNQNVRPAKLAERHKQTIQEIEKLQEVERFLFQNLQSISDSAPDSASKKQEIRKKIDELVVFRKELLNKLKAMYTSAQIEVTQRRYDLADQIAVGKTMEDELQNTNEQIQALEAEKMNKERMVKIGEYEYSRYSEFRGMLKVVVYGCFIALLISFLMKQPWFPSTLGVAGLGITAAWVLITLVGRLVDNFKRDSLEWSRFKQTNAQRYKDEVEASKKVSGGSGGLARLLGLTCPNPDENFQIMGVRPHESKTNKFSYLQ